MATSTVDYDGSSFIVFCPFHDNQRAKLIPTRTWDKKTKAWLAPVCDANIKYLVRNYTKDEITEKAESAIREATNLRKKQMSQDFPSWYQFREPPMAHQKEALNYAWGKKGFAFHHEMGVGKTFTAINLMSAYAMNGDIDFLVVVCPSAIKHIWPEQWEQFKTLPDSDVMVLMPNNHVKAKEFVRGHEGFPILVVGVEAFSSGKWKNKKQPKTQSNLVMSKTGQLLMDLFVGKRVGIVLDESSTVKNHKSIRSMSLHILGEHAVKKVTLTGTPVTQGIQDLYSQFKFLDWEIIGHRSYYTFQNRYCVMGGFEGRQITGYDNVNELMDLLSPYTHVVTKEQALDLPPKVYETIKVPPTPEQISAIKSLKKTMMLENKGNKLTVDNALEMLGRLNQICGGMVAYELPPQPVDLAAIPFGDQPKKSKKKFKVEPLPGKNPKLEALMDVFEWMPDDASVIIWARYIPEIHMIYDFLESKYPGQAITYYGGTTYDERKEANRAFQAKEKRFFISNQVTGGKGLTLTAASYVVYFSNSYSFQDRVQSEDRAHRKGQRNTVTYLDLILDVAIERKMMAALKQKEGLADLVERELSGSRGSVVSLDEFFDI